MYMWTAEALAAAKARIDQRVRELVPHQPGGILSRPNLLAKYPNLEGYTTAEILACIANKLREEGAAAEEQWRIRKLMNDYPRKWTDQ